MRNYRIKVCVRCGKEFQTTGSCQKYCPECKIIVLREYQKEYHKQYEKQYRLEHSEHLKQYMKQYYQTAKGKEARKKYVNKHRRNLGFIPLNKYFEGSEFHHIDRERGLYIPIEVHKNIPHCLETAKGMKKINTLAVQWWITNQVLNKYHKRV